MAAIARSTPSFALPATQNTAPVHEFRCLYTHDVRKKAKKWHDGSARFHTFNKRVMVYDDTKNYIGDLHYRADEDFGEGVELQLDRGVLVEVGERVGETQTDVTGIRNKPHAATGIASTASTDIRSRPIQRTNNLSSQGRPKSLVELLGTPQGRHGRANLPLTSPFEQRQALVGTQHVEPPAKKQKTSLGKENSLPVAQRKQPTYSTGTDHVSKYATSPPAAPRVSNVRHASPQVSPRWHNANSNVIDISSEEDLQSRSEPATKKGRKPDEKTTSRDKEKRSVTASSSKKNKGNSSLDTLMAPTSSKPPTQVLARPLSLLTASSANSASSLRPGVSQLKMQTQKPRRKLMYKALLPPTAVDQEASTPSAAVQEQERSSHDGQIQKPIPAQDIQANDYDQDLELDDFERLVSPSKPSPLPHGANRTPQRPTQTLQISQPSPLFVSQNGSQRSPTPARSFVEDEFDIPATQQIHNVRNSTIKSNGVVDLMQGSTMDNIQEPESPCFPQPPPALKSVAQPSLPSMAPPKLAPLNTIDTNLPTAKQRTPTPKTNRPFARCLSDNDSLLPCDARVSSPHPSLDPVEGSPTRANPRVSPLHPPPLPSIVRSRNPSPVKSPFQRCRSDTDAIIPTTVAAPAPISTVNEEGPWTKTEAFLLFDKWPTCKQKDKPVFEPVANLNRRGDDGMGDSDFDDDGIEYVPAPKPVQRMRIRTARSFLRDG